MAGGRVGNDPAVFLFGAGNRMDNTKNLFDWRAKQPCVLFQTASNSQRFDLQMVRR
jgi:hypothetical protein